MNDIRWFAANDDTRLVASELRSRGLEIAAFFPPQEDAALVAGSRRVESAAPRSGPFDHITIEAAGARFFEALEASLNH